LTPITASKTIALAVESNHEVAEMSEECVLREGVELNLDDVEKIAIGLKSLAAYSMLAYEHEEDPQDLETVVQDGLDAINRLFDC
jgi:hypothetical protein